MQCTKFVLLTAIRHHPPDMYGSLKLSSVPWDLVRSVRAAHTSYRSSAPIDISAAASIIDHPRPLLIVLSANCDLQASWRRCRVQSGS